MQLMTDSGTARTISAGSDPKYSRLSVPNETDRHDCSIVGNREIKTALPEAGKFFRNGQSRDLALSIRA
jgi:hypothetical protein